ncbi:MAG TPA: methyltransferase domain-containing protein [Bryobacteraceae bacterium]
MVRFSSLVRKGLRFRRAFEDAKKKAGPQPLDWYPYDCFANLFYVQHLLQRATQTLDDAAGGAPLLDLGAADGALSFFLESLGYRVDACDHAGTNINRMQGLRTLASILGSRIEIHDLNLDGRFELHGQYGLAVFLGTLYHLKNPFYVLETLAGHARFCFLSTRIARRSPDAGVRFENIPAAYLLDPRECNADATNYWIFSPPGLLRLAQRTGWRVLASATSGAAVSDPATTRGDEQMFLLLENQS